MKTNEEAKQEAIKKAWVKAGFNWEQIKDLIVFDGCIELTTPSLKIYLKGYKEAHSLGLLKAVDYNGNSLTVQLLTLKDINFNNGWNRIEPDEILSKTSGIKYKIILEDGSEEENDINYSLFEIAKMWKITHYKPITPEELPVY